MKERFFKRNRYDFIRGKPALQFLDGRERRSVADTGIYGILVDEDVAAFDLIAFIKCGPGDLFFCQPFLEDVFFALADVG